MTGLWILLAAVALAAVVGLVRARTDGRFGGRPAAQPEPARATPQEPTPQEPSAWDAVVASGVAEAPGERATLLQFSSAFCAPCRATRRVLGEVAEVVPGVAHVEVDAEHHLDLVRRLKVVRTPTTLVLDAAGREVARAAGAPTKQQVLAGLERAV
ncbi:thioredoxin family protein [Nocardioides zeae]|uniref:Thioredoxin family protein n=1 Tax=Nocardioides imazamoxiresistens TaxID=3231893 RepID=A0ABU3PQK2_9ACTN|nr:thioredoxin family protein [Nocardioides zeae]MDT9591494.1 thioredoxin family protein [Nocardioides zeae]